MTARGAAEALAAGIAERLADPWRVAAHHPASRPAWQDLTLSEGLPGIALLHLERGHSEGGHTDRGHTDRGHTDRGHTDSGHTDSEAMRTAHRWLAEATARAATAPSAAPRPSLYYGVPALSFVLSRAAAAVGRPLRAAEQLGAQLRRYAREVAARELRRRPGDSECVTMAAYDVVSGLTGLGAQLLDDAPGRDALADVLTALVALTVPVRLKGGRTLPGWWTAQGPGSGYPRTTPEAGHANAGLAHGAPGPLALLALAWEQGVVVPGHEAAMHTLAGWLTDIRVHDERGTRWPRALVLHPASGTTVATDDGPDRPAWCYGAVGVCRALYLAGRALDVPQWRNTALAGFHSELARAQREEECEEQADPGLCHGWGGVLQITWRMAHDTGDPRLHDLLPWLARRITSRAAPDEPFGLRHPSLPRSQITDRTGFLTGAAGTALALRTFATGTAPATGWDRALLIA
ncbi:lanthionine synthetase C family protein [Streptomyces sp. URMC 127]|uniref:lanthionine synthetase C family protein n=1 Tax=Streptomyces sp. URMC 127 TaxID=3423402 RepID=UPI003F197AA8